MRIRTQTLAIPFVAVGLLASGCGGGSDDAHTTAIKPAAATTAQAPSSSGDQAVKNTILDWSFKGGCDYMTGQVHRAAGVVARTSRTSRPPTPS